MSRTSSSSCCDDVEVEGEEKFHPFIQAELERLNFATQEVNSLEARLEESRILFIEVNKERTSKLDEVMKRLGKCVEKARPYYDAKARQKALQSDVQRAAQMFERACSTVEAAKEMVQLAEQSIINIGTLDGDWQEVLNHATERVLKAEKDKADSEQVHRIHAEELAKIALSCATLERSVKNCITKSAVYFELLQSYNDRLEAKKQEIRELEMSLQTAKHTYSLALSTLENISNIIHQRRRAFREKRLHQSSDGATDDPAFLDVPDLIRQLSVSSSSSARPESYQQEKPSSCLLTTVHTSQSTTTVNTAVNTSSSPFTFPSSTRPIQTPLKTSTTIRAGVVISASDLLRSIGLVHLAETMPQQPPIKPQQHLPPYLKPSGAKGLTSSSSTYSLPTQSQSSQTPSTTKTETRPHQHVVNNEKVPIPQSTNNGNPSNHQRNNSNPIAVSCPSPSLSDVSTASSTTAGSHRRIFIMHRDHSGRSSENEDTPNGEDTNGSNNNKHHNNLAPINSAESIMSVTPVSIDAVSATLNASPQSETSEAAAS